MKRTTETIYDYIKRERQFLQKHEKNPTEEDMALMMGITIDEIKEIKTVMRDPFLTQTIYKSWTINLPDLYEIGEADYLLLEQNLHKVLDRFDDDQRRILEYRFDIKNGQRRPLDKVSEKMNTSQDRVRWLEQVALKAVKSEQNAFEKHRCKLKDYLE